MFEKCQHAQTAGLFPLCRAKNARIRKAQILTKLADKYTTYQQVLNAHATKELTGDFLLPFQKLETKTYSATEIGDILGISANKVGVLANCHNLKTDEYGEWFKDKGDPRKKCVKENKATPKQARI